MAWILGKIKCCFCEKIDGVISSVPKYGIYANDVDGRIFFHDECLEVIQLDPEKYGHKVVDRAVDIQDRMQDARKINSDIIKRYLENVKKLQQGHLERMMPKKS